MGINILLSAHREENIETREFLFSSMQSTVLQEKNDMRFSNLPRVRIGWKLGFMLDAV